MMGDDYEGDNYEGDNAMNASGEQEVRSVCLESESCCCRKCLLFHNSTEEGGRGEKRMKGKVVVPFDGGTALVSLYIDVRCALMCCLYLSMCVCACKYISVFSRRKMDVEQLTNINNQP